MSKLIRMILALQLSISAVSAFAFGSGTPSDGSSPPPLSNQPPPSLQHVFVVVLENENEENALQQPYLKKLASDGAYFSNYHGVTHPSQPNYIAMVSGSSQGVFGDGNVDINTAHLADLLEEKKLTWKVYAEGYPGNCFLGAGQGAYVRRHVPFLSFENIQKNKRRCQKIANADELEQDWAHGTLPNYVLYVPDLNNDGHDTTVGYAAAWLKKRFGSYLSDAKFMKDMLFVVTFDESGINLTNHIYTVALGDQVMSGAVIDPLALNELSGVPLPFVTITLPTGLCVFATERWTVVVPVQGLTGVHLYPPGPAAQEYDQVRVTFGATNPP